MKQNFNAPVSRRVVARAASALVAALCQSAGSGQAVLVTTYNTGTATPGPGSALLAPGTVDPNYARVVFPALGGGALPELRRGAEIHRGHPGAAGD